LYKCPTKSYKKISTGQKALVLDKGKKRINLSSTSKYNQYFIHYQF